MEEDFKQWLEQKTVGWYLLPNQDYEWYLNQWLNDMEEKRKEQRNDEMV